MTEAAPRPAPSPETRRLIDALKECSGLTGAYHLCASDGIAADAHEEAADLALSDHVAGLEAEVARLRAFLSPFGRFGLGARVRKIKGSSWQGRVVGFYGTALTPIGYAVESEREPGSVQIYPQAALELMPEDAPHADR